MGMKMLVEEVREIANAVWLARLAPHEVKLMGAPKTTQGNRSVVLVEGAKFDDDDGFLQVDASTVQVLNLGTSLDTVFIGSTSLNAGTSAADGDTPLAEGSSGPGDKEYLRLVEKELRGEAQNAATAILREVRTRYPGDLQRGKRSNFKNTPDNFWYVIVQPRAQSLSITVRGRPERFESEVLEIKQDRPGYTRFIIKEMSEVPEALRIIEHSKRKEG